jgi:tetratricopeptide (TPR) repeat protein
MDSAERRLPPALWAALAAGLALRAWYFFDLAAQPWHGFPLVDALTNDRIALALLGDAPAGAFFRPPLYPLLLAAVYRLAGHAATPVVWLQFALGLATLVPAWRLGERWFGRGAATAGAWIAAVYPLRIFFEGEALDATLFTFLFVWGVWTLWLALERASAGRALWSGALLGAAVLTRPNLLVALPFVAAGAALAFRGAGRPRARQAAAWAAGICLAVAPATVHNWRATGEFIPVAANGGVNFYLGNARGATGLTPVPPGLRWEQVMLRPVRAGLATLGAQERWWYDQAWGQIGAAPGRWLRLLGVKAALFANAAESSNNKALGRFTGVSFPVRHYRGWFGALLCLALVGIAARRGPGAVFLALTTAGFAVSVALFFVTERYRLPLVPLLASAAAAGAGELWRAVRAREHRRALALAALGAAAALAVFPDWFGAGTERINADFQLAQVFLMRGEPARALEAAERARAADPRDPDVLNSLGAARVGLGDLDGAEAAYRAALGLGDFAEVWFNLGVVAEKRGAGGRAAAIACYRRALEINPVDPRSRANLAALEAGDGEAGPTGGGRGR